MPTNQVINNKQARSHDKIKFLNNKIQNMQILTYIYIYI